MIGKRQQEELQKWDYPGYRLNIVQDTRYLNSRETGHGYRAMLHVVHIESGDVEYRTEIARCQNLITLERKCNEIMEYVRALPNQKEPA